MFSFSVHDQLVVCFQMVACTLFTQCRERGLRGIFALFFINKHWAYNKFNEIHEDTGDKAVICVLYISQMCIVCLPYIEYLLE